MNYIEIEGDPKQENVLMIQTACPSSNDTIKSIFCPFRDECELLKIYVRADSASEATTYLEYAESTEQIPRCKNGKPFLTKMFNYSLPFHPRWGIGE